MFGNTHPNQPNTGSRFLRKVRGATLPKVNESEIQNTLRDTIIYRTYMPNKISYVLDIWRTELAKINEKAGQSLADPQQYENLFPGFYDSVKTQQFLLPERSTLLPASSATTVSIVFEAAE